MHLHIITENGHGWKRFECVCKFLANNSSKVDSVNPPKILHILSVTLRMPSSGSYLVDFGLFSSSDNFSWKNAFIRRNSIRWSPGRMDKRRFSYPDIVHSDARLNVKSYVNRFNRFTNIIQLACPIGDQFWI